MIPSFSRKVLSAAALISAVVPLSRAGIMDPAVGLQTYRDFAENRGEFAPGATNVTVYNTDGVAVGTIARVMNFDSVVDGGWSSLTGGASFLSTVSHNNATDISFTTRFGATSGTPYYDSYHVINYNRGWGSNLDYNYDYAVPRLNKIVTEAAAVPYLTDTSILNNMVGRDVLRVGGGTQNIADTTGGGGTTVSGAYNYLTGGTISFTGETARIPQPGTVPPNANGTTYTSQVVDPTKPASAYNSYSFTYNNQAADASQPLDIGIMGGDSGSSCWTYDTTTARWEYVAAAQSGSVGGGFGSFNQMRSGNAYSVATINAYNSPTVTASAGGGNITWNAPAADGTGTFTQGATSWNYVGLASNVRGATSTLAADGVSTTAATDAAMDATRNLVFAGSGGTIVLGGSVDMGAGSLTFQNNYTLSDGGVTTRRLNSAGFIIGGGYTVTSNLTGISGDEWRVVNDSVNGTGGMGTFVVGGSGNNNADLNFGGDLLVLLNRTGGVAAHNVKINGGAVGVRLMQANQISGDIIFGHRGGTLDLYGQNRTTDHITHLDNGAEFANFKANTDSTFTYIGSGAQTYLGGFSDGGSLANGRLNLVYDPGTPSGAVWNLSGVNNIAGTVTVSGGELRIAGTPTLHAGGYVDPDDWQTAVFNGGTVGVASGATFTAADHANVGAAVSVAGGGAFQLLTGANHTGNVALNASNAAFNAVIASGAATESGAITGTGGLSKSGAGTLNLTNAGNTFSGAKTLSGGSVSGTSLAALGDTTTNKWSMTNASVVISASGATAAQVKAKIATGALGTLALAGSNPDAAPDMTGYSGLWLGAIGAQSVGTAGTTSTLTAWNGTGWNLGGGGGTLTMNLKLSGAGTLTVGNGLNTGTVVLTNAHNNDTAGGAAFTGMINVNPGVSLRFTDINALGTLTGSDRIAVAYGARLALGSAANAVSVFNTVTTGSAGVLGITGTDTNAYSFSGQGLNSAVLGADGTAVYSGTLTPGTGGYRFGGNGNLTVTSVLSGTNALSADGQGTTGGVTTLSGNNTFTGAVTVQGGTVNGILGSHTLKLGSAGALGSGNAVTINDGGVVDLNGKTSTFGALNGGAASALENSSATASTLTISQSANTTMAGDISGTGALNLVKSGTGVLTLSGDNSQTGTVAINAGAIKLGSSTALGAATNAVTVASGGALDFAGNSAPGNPLTVSGTGNGTLGALHNSVAATTATLGTVTLAGNTTMSGAGTTAAFSPGTINLGGNTLTLTNARLNTGDSNLTNGNITGGANSLFYVGGTQTGAGSTGTWTLGTGSELMVRDYDNTTVTAMKTLVLDGGKISNGNIDNGGGAQSTIDNNITVNSGGGAIIANNWSFGKDLRFAGTLAGSGALTISGSRAAEFQGDTSGYTGAINLAGGKINMNGAANQSLSGVISGSGSLIKSGATTLTLTGNSTYAGTTTINAGTISLGNGGTSGSLGAGAVANNGSLVFNRSDTFTVTNAISGTGTVSQNGAGTTVLSGGNTFAGGSSVNSGTLRVTSVTGLGTGAVTLNGGTLSFAIQGLNFNSIAGTSMNTGAVSGGSFTSDFSPLHNTSGNVVPGNTTYAYTGKVYLTAGQWSFGENFDDAAYVKVNNTVVVNNAAWNTPTSGSITIATDGWYDIDVRAWQGGGGVGPVNASGWGPGKGVGVKTGGTSTDGSLFTAFGTDAAGIRLGTGGTITVANAVNLAANATVEILDAGPGGATRLSGVVSGAGALTKTGTGTLILSGTNTYAGGTTVNAGTLTAGSSTAFGSGAVTVNAATLDLGAISVTTGAVSLNGGVIQNGTLNGTSYTTNSGTVSAILAGTGTLTQSGGTTTLSGNNTYTGGTTINSGTLVAGSSAAFGTGAVTVNAATLDLGAISVTTGAVSLNGGTIQNGTLSGSSYTTSAGTISAVLAGSGSLTQSGTGTTTLSGNNTYTGNTTVTAGTLSVDSDANLGAAPIFPTAGRLTLDGGTLKTTGAFTLNANRGVALGASGGTIDSTALSTTQTFTVGSIVAGSGPLTIKSNGDTSDTGGGTPGLGVDLRGANTFTGGITITSGLVSYLSDAAFGAAGNKIILNGGGLLDANRNLTLAHDIVVNAGGGTFRTYGATNATFTGAITGSGAIRHTDGGVINLAGNLSGYTGTYDNRAGATNLTGTGAIGGDWAVTTGTLGFNASGSQGLAGTVSGSGSVTKSGSGTTTLSGANTYSGGTTISGGAVRIADNDSALGTGTIGFTGNALLATALGGGARTLSNDVTVSSGVTASLDGGYATLTLTGTVSGAGNLAKSSSGTVVLTGTNTYSGTTTIAATSGGLRVGAGGTTGSLGSGSVSIGSGGSLTYDRSDSVTVANTISGAGTLAFAGTGVSNQSAYSLTGNNSGLTGAVTATNARAQADNSSGNRLGAGALTTGAGGQFFLTGGTFANAMTISGDGWQETAGLLGALRLAGDAVVSGAVTLTGDTRITAYNDSGVISGAIGETGGARALEIGGAGQLSGTVTLAGTNTYSGTTTISSGVLKIGSGGTTGTLGSGAVVDNAALVFDRSDAISVGNTISGTGAVVQSGAGTTTLLGANSHTGGTVVNSGTLVLGNAGALGSASGTLIVSGGALDLGAYSVATGDITVSGGAIQNGTITGASYSTSSGTVSAILAGSGALTQNGAGTTTLSGNNTYTGGTTVSSGTLALGGAGTLGATTNALTATGGTLDLGAKSVTTGAVAVSGGSIQNGTLTGASYSTSSGSVSAVLAGTGALTQNGAGTTTLTGANTYTGATTVSAGTLQIGAGGTTGSLGTAAATVASGATLTFNRSNALTVTNSLGGAGTIRQVGSGNLTLSNTGSASIASFLVVDTGTVTITGGGFGGNRMNGNGLVTVNSGASLVITGTHALGGSNTGMTESVVINGGSMTLNNEQYFNNLTLNGATVNGSGNLRASNATNWTVGGSSASTIANTVGLYNTANFNVGDATGSSATDLTVSGAVLSPSGYTGKVVKTGSGTMLLSGANTYTTGTTVNAGRLIAGSNTAFGTGAVTVNSGGTLSVGIPGAGRTIANAITVASGGALAGTASLSGGVTLAAGAAYVWSIVNSAPTVAGTDFDRLVITAGTFTLNANSVLKIDASGVDYSTAFWDSGHTFSFVTKSGTGAISGAFSSLDTSSAGLFDSRGSWSVTSDSSGLSAVWTAGEALQGMSMQTTSTQAVPEPATYGLLGAGALALVAAVRRRRK